MGRVRTVTTLLSVLVAAGTVRAGVYNLAERRAVPSMAQLDRDVRLQLLEMTPKSINGDIGELRGSDDRTLVAAEKAKETTSFRNRYLGQAEKLETKQKAGPLAVTDAIDLSACYLRLGRADKAVALLEETLAKLPKDEPHQFLVLLNRAAAYETTPEYLDRAILSQKQALRAWPTELPGWKLDDLLWYRRAEQYYLTLLQTRFAELQRNGGRPLANPSIDALFPIRSADPMVKAYFGGGSRPYRAGPASPEAWDELPPDAFALVVQLMLWLPNDARLRWLYAELLNARGEVKAAAEVLHDLSYNWGMSGVSELMAHRSVVKRAADELPDKPEAETQVAPMTATPPSAPVPKASDLWVPDWRQLAGGFFAGAVVTALVMMQVREWARRRGERS